MIAVGIFHAYSRSSKQNRGYATKDAAGYRGGEETVPEHKAGRIVLGAVADDYTGATDLANSFAARGSADDPDDRCSLMQHCRLPSAMPSSSRSRAVRSPADRGRGAVTQGAMTGCVCRAARMSCSRSARPSIQTDAGNIGPVMDALKPSDDGPVIVCPAFPRSGAECLSGSSVRRRSPAQRKPVAPSPAQSDA